MRAAVFTGYGEIMKGANIGDSEMPRTVNTVFQDFTWLSVLSIHLATIHRWYDLYRAQKMRRCVTHLIW